MTLQPVGANGGGLTAPSSAAVRSERSERSAVGWSEMLGGYHSIHSQRETDAS